MQMDYNNVNYLIESSVSASMMQGHGQWNYILYDSHVITSIVWLKMVKFDRTETTQAIREKIDTNLHILSQMRKWIFVINHPSVVETIKWRSIWQAFISNYLINLFNYLCKWMTLLSITVLFCHFSMTLCGHSEVVIQLLKPTV